MDEGDIRIAAMPFVPDGAAIGFVPASDPFMQAAREIARTASKDKNMPTGSAVVLGGKIIGRGANGSEYHDTHECERVKRGIPTGQGYELCEGCHPKNHSEPRAVADALKHHSDLSRATLYLWGHWWCCEPCWRAMTGSGITHVMLQDDAQKLFDKNSPHHIAGRQFNV